MKIGYSIWLEDDEGNKVFGEGPYELLILVDRLGSLNKASAEMGMSYSKTINIIKKSERALDIKLLEREIGGAQGGGSKLTRGGKDLVKKYEKLREISSRKLEEAYNEAFQEFK